MTVKIPMLTPVTREDGYTSGRSTPAWRNFWDSIDDPYSVDALSNDNIGKALEEYGGVWRRGTGMIEFASEEQAVMWVLRWS